MNKKEQAIYNAGFDSGRTFAEHKLCEGVCNCAEKEADATRRLIEAIED